MNFNHTINNNNRKEIEKFVGIEIFSSSDVKGIGGVYKDSYKDFIVKEIIENGQILEIKEDQESPPYLKEKDKFTTFNLVKINKTTFEGLHKINTKLNISRYNIYYSGLKDKCSISVQKVSIRGNFIEDLRKLKIRDFFFRSITPTKKPVMLGSNKGNNFTIKVIL